MGTPLYMSPEQCKGAGLLDHRTDIYSLGVILFEMISGRPPFTAEGVGELFAKHMLEDAPPVTEFAPNAPPHMAAAIMKSLAKDPDARFANMEDFRKAIVGEIKVAMAVSSGKKHPLLQHAGSDDVAARVDDAVVGVVRDRRVVRPGAAPAPDDVRAAGRRRSGGGAGLLLRVQGPDPGRGPEACGRDDDHAPRRRSRRRHRQRRR